MSFEVVNWDGLAEEWVQ